MLVTNILGQSVFIDRRAAQNGLPYVKLLGKMKKSAGICLCSRILDIPDGRGSGLQKRRSGLDLCYSNLFSSERNPAAKRTSADSTGSSSSADRGRRLALSRHSKGAVRPYESAPRRAHSRRLARIVSPLWVLGVSPADALALARRFYAEDVCFPLDNRRLIDAFATVPREAFVGPGPWLIQNRHTAPHYLPTKDADPRHLYHDVHIALDASGFVNSGGPGFNAFLLNLLEVQPGETVVYLGMGCGYYAAILAELVGPGGKVMAIEVDPERAAQAGQSPSPLAAGHRQVR